MDKLITRLTADHDRIRALLRTLGDLFATSGTPDLAKVACCRWQLTREVMQHLPVEDKAVYGPLAGTSAGATAQAAWVELDSLYSDYRRHVTEWPAERVAADWDGFRASVQPLAERLTARMEREERELYPLAMDIRRLRPTSCAQPAPFGARLARG